MHNVIAAQPITDSHGAFLLLDDDGVLSEYAFEHNMPLHLSVTDTSRKYCVGWYNIANHTNHPCDARAVVDRKYDSCFACRRRTDFNPAFYNTDTISTKQAEYNATPHTLYVAYFGNGIAKAGIMADSRGLDRIYEQGALMYALVETYTDATRAHNAEARLIAAGLRNSVTKKQKEKVLETAFDVEKERDSFTTILTSHDLDKLEITCNLDHFFYSHYLPTNITPFGDNPVSGTIRGVIGRYLVLENNDRLYGTWLTDLYGYELSIDDHITVIDHPPEQVSLF